jgi:carbamoyl-phosphate synthase small subunit
VGLAAIGTWRCGGPEDSHYLFTRFVNLMREQRGLPVKKER